MPFVDQDQLIRKVSNEKQHKLIERNIIKRKEGNRRGGTLFSLSLSVLVFFFVS